MPPNYSNIRAYVQWKEPAVYAGEEIECIITFKNIATLPRAAQEGVGENSAVHSRSNSVARIAAHSRKSSTAVSKLPPLSRAPSVAASVQSGTGHRPALSLNVTAPSSRAGSNGLQGGGLQSGVAPVSGSRPSGKSHARSLSIMSLGSEVMGEGRTPTAPNTTGKRPGKAHGRSASLQYSPNVLSQSPVTMSMTSPRQPSPLYETVTPPESTGASNQPLPIKPTRRRPGVASAGNTPQLGGQSGLRKQASAEAQDESSFTSFKFPPSSQNPKNGSKSADIPSRPALSRNPSTMHSSRRTRSPRPAPDSWSGGLNNLNPVSRVMSETSNDGTPRNSSEIYPMSNHSDETLMSELPTQHQFGRLLPKAFHSRRSSRSPQNRPTEPETLMMAYAQTMGSFTLDGILVNAAPFEEVKRKGVQGGGGVVGIEQSKRSSGLFGALSWGNIGESLGGLLGGDEMSSMAQMKASAGSKTIPLLSTPQSLLFVDLRLAPGESRGYSYRFSLPRGLPPSHRGRAIKVTYHLSLSVQRPEGQLVKSVDVPFRVLGSYDTRGDMLGHDLMSPYVLLQDEARTMGILPGSDMANGQPQFQSLQDPKSKKTPKKGLEDFLRYTERLLETPVDENGILLSPTSPASPISPNLSRQGSGVEQPPTSIRDAIDFAILRCNHAHNDGKAKQSASQNANRFNIARSGQPVAVLTMLRPAYRLGEVVTGIIAFNVPPPSARTYSVLVELESSEQVDPSLALRSATSINRVTRKTYAAIRENTIFARQISFSLAIPSGAAPTFETTGVSLHWRLRVEFMTERQVQGLGIERDNSGEEELLEQLGSDERGTTFIAKERLMADTFEIAVPLRVYGAVGMDNVRAESEGLIV